MESEISFFTGSDSFFSLIILMLFSFGHLQWFFLVFWFGVFVVLCVCGFVVVFLTKQNKIFM